MSHRKIWSCFLRAGGAWRDDDSPGALRALWCLLVPDDGFAWFERQTWSTFELTAMFEQFCDVWWRYCAALPGARVGELHQPTDVLRVVDIACEQLRCRSRTRSVFVAVLFQLAVTLRHDQSTCCVNADLTRPPFYSHYVNRAHVGSMFSLRTLIDCETRYACARRTVAKFRGVKGRVVAEVFDVRGKELIRRPRSKIKRFTCSKCSVKVRPRCKRCTRMQELDPQRLISYYGHHHEWVSVPDAQTVCGDVEFVAAGKVLPTSTVVHAGESWRVVKRARGRDDCGKAGKVVLHLERQSDAQTQRAQLSCAPKSIVVVRPCASDCYEMMRDNASVVHGMCMSVPLDRTWRDRCSADDLSQPYEEHPLKIVDARDVAQVARYAAWRSVVAVVAFILGEDAATHPVCEAALRAATTHALYPGKSMPETVSV